MILPNEIRFGAGHAPFLPMHYRNANVLIVEDQPIAMEIVSELLSSVGITAHQASNGQEAIDILGRLGPTAFDLVLMDIQMPVMSGVEATRLIRKQEELTQRRSTPIIALTANTMTHQLPEYEKAGFSGVVAKPIQVGLLMQALLDTIATLETDTRE